jgi:hypothetical protein
MNFHVRENPDKRNVKLGVKVEAKRKEIHVATFTLAQ